MAQSGTDPVVIKACLVGSAGVGCTSIIRRLQSGPTGALAEDGISANADFTTYDYTLETGVKVKITLFDMAPQQSQLEFLTRRADIVFFVFNLLHAQSLAELDGLFAKARANIETNDSLVILVANKSDLQADSIIPVADITAVQAAISAKELFYTSTKDSNSLEIMLNKVCEEYMRFKHSEKTRGFTLAPPPPQRERSSGGLCFGEGRC